MTASKSKLKMFSLGFLSILLAINAFAQNEQQRIKFARGENSATVSGSVSSGKNDSYLIGGREGQKMSVRISSGGKNAAFQIRDAANGTYLGSAGSDATEWSGALPTTGDYEIVVSGSADYKLTVTIK